MRSEAALTLLRHTLATLEDLDDDPEYWTAKLRQTQEQQMLMLAKRAAGLVDLLARSGVLSNYTQEEGQGWLGSNLKQAISAAIIMNWVTAPHCHCIRPVAVPDFLKRDLPRKTADAQALKDWLSDLYDYTTLMDPHAMLDFDYDEDGNALPPSAEATFVSVTLPRHDFPLQPQQMACLHPALTPDLTALMLHGLYSVLPEPHQDEEPPGKDAQCLATVHAAWPAAHAAPLRLLCTEDPHCLAWGQASLPSSCPVCLCLQARCCQPSCLRCCHNSCSCCGTSGHN